MISADDRMIKFASLNFMI